SLFIIGHMGLFFYNKIGSIRSIGDLPTTNIIEPKSLQTTSALSATSKRCFEQPMASFLVCFLIFIEYKSGTKMSDQDSQILVELREVFENKKPHFVWNKVWLYFIS
ncbi:MAG: hypothetical protein E7H16_08765, partial [Streptococcus mitis]|nr:hypothetical protein [Streptococcus mitis]